jgi:YbbR domain-containing protein
VNVKKVLKRFNILVFALSLVIAVILWGYVSLFLNPTGTRTVSNIPVLFINESSLAYNGLIMVSDRNMTVDAKFEGRNQDYTGLNAENLVAEVDLRGVIGAGETTLDYKLKSTAGMTIQLSSLITTLYTPSVTVTVDYIGEKPVPVEVSALPQSGENMMVEAVEFDHSNITVSGPSKIVGTIEKAVVDYTPDGVITNTLVNEYSLILHTRDGEVGEEDMRLLTLDYDTVIMTIPVSRVKTVPLDISCIDGGGLTKNDNILLSFSPATVRISGDPAVLEGINSVLLSETVNLASLSGDTTGTYPILFPESVRNIDNITEAQVEITLWNVDTKDISTTNITAMNVNTPPGYQYIIRSSPLVITVRGSHDDVLRVQPHNIRVVADFGGVLLTPGVSQQAAVVTVEGIGEVGVVDMDYAVLIEVVPEEPPAATPLP